jgi:CheY-like chemotaxis protein
MFTKTILIVEDNPETLNTIQRTLVDANVIFQICSSESEGWDVFRSRPEISQVLIRMQGVNIDGCALCRRIREEKSAEQLPIVMIVGEDQLENAAGALDAGATDVLIDPFESRELRMRTSIPSSTSQRRVDKPHPVSVPESPDKTIPAADEPSDELRLVPEFVVPKFDAKSQRFVYGVSDAQISDWENDDSVAKVALDEVMVCPCCSGIPTFRQGCGSCGSAWTRPEMLIHHYACAYIGPEDEFRQADRFVCPKCRQTDLVAGSDFETVPGGMICADCHTQTSQPELIGHCLSCQHRFPAAEAVTLQLRGFHVHRVPETAVHRGTRRNRPQPRPISAAAFDSLMALGAADCPVGSDRSGI